MNTPLKRVSLVELREYRAAVKGSLFRQIRKRLNDLKKLGFTQEQLAARLRVDPGQLSRQLKGEKDLRLETLSDMARGLECRIDVELVPLTDSVKAWIDNVPAEAFVPNRPTAAIG